MSINLVQLAGEEVRVIDYRIIEGIGIILSLENTKKEVVCPSCGKTTELLHQNNFQTVRDLAFGQQSVYLKINRRRMRCPHCQNKFIEKLEFVRKRRAFGFRNFDNFQPHFKMLTAIKQPF